jgi:hypothetical protein
MNDCAQAGAKFMPDEWDALIAAAVKKASDTSNFEDINKAAEIAKAVAEAGKAKADTAKAIAEASKATTDTENSRAQMTWEGLKSLATFLVPLVSFATIGFTVWIQQKQLQETQRQDEATQWREFLTSAKPSPNTVPSDPTFAPRLRSFFSSPTYRDQAISISKHLMGGIADLAGFKDLFEVTFVTVSSDTFSDVIDVGRSLNSNLTKYYSNCQIFTDDLGDNIRKKVPASLGWGGICSQALEEKAIKDFGLNAEQSKTLSQLRRDTAAFVDENAFLTHKITDYLRANYTAGSPASPGTTVPFNGLYIFNADLSNVDFSNFDIADTAFETCILTGAKFTPKKYGKDTDIRATEWWEVREIDQGLLEKLVQNNYPYILKDENYPNNAAVDKKRYTARISALCVPMKPFCQPTKLQFGK